jgi:hypothetical protein
MSRRQALRGRQGSDGGPRIGARRRQRMGGGTQAAAAGAPDATVARSA